MGSSTADWNQENCSQTTGLVSYGIPPVIFQSLRSLQAGFYCTLVLCGTMSWHCVLTGLYTYDFYPRRHNVPLQNPTTLSTPTRSIRFSKMLCQSSCRRANGRCPLDRGLIKERNSELAVYIGSKGTGGMIIPQQLLKNTYPVISNALQRSGNRFINPVQRISPRFTSVFEYENAEDAMQLLMSTLQRISCQDPYCPNFTSNPLLDPLRNSMELAVRRQDPLLYEAAVERYLQLMNSYASLHSLQDPQGANDFINSQLYPHLHERAIGLGSRIDPFIRETALRFMPSIVEGGASAIFAHIQVHYRITGNDTNMVVKLIQNLRLEEQLELYDLAMEQALDYGDVLSWKIVKILRDEPIDRASFVAWKRELGLS
jgi:hypothetical protein